MIENIPINDVKLLGSRIERKSVIICPDCKKRVEVPFRGQDKYYNICIECNASQFGEYKRDN